MTIAWFGLLGANSLEALPGEGGTDWGPAMLAVAVVFLIFQTWRGWKLGVIRSGLSVVAIVGSGIIGWYGGMVAANLFGAFLPVSRAFIWAASGITLALGVYIAATLVSAILFKKTGHQSSGILRFFFGLGGAVCGLFVGLVIVWAAFSGIRSMGRISEGGSGDSSFLQGVESQMAGAKDSLETGRTGSVVRSADPIPQSLYDTLGKVSKVTRDEEAMLRFIEHPELQALVMHPVMTELTSDPHIQKAAEKKNYFALLSNPKVIRAATDPDFARVIADIDFQKALDSALENPSTPSQQIQTPTNR